MDRPYRPDLPETFALERNMLGVPIFVMHAKTSHSTADLSYEWVGEEGQKALFVFEKSKSCPFPLPQHAMYLSIMLAMFANNFREDGWFRFRFSDVVRNAGRSSQGRGSVGAVKETIRRYSTHSARWHYAWKGQQHTWHGPFILAEDVWTMTKDGIKIKRNPRNTKGDEDTWHRIRFHPHIVESVQSGLTRIFLTEALREGLSPAAFCIYRYFFNFSDRSEVRRSITTLMTAFPWRGQKDRFIKWLQEGLQELKNHGLVEGFSVTTALVGVRCRPIEEAKKTRRHLRAIKTHSDAFTGEGVGEPLVLIRERATF